MKSRSEATALYHAKTYMEDLVAAIGLELEALAGVSERSERQPAAEILSVAKDLVRQAKLHGNLVAAVGLEPTTYGL